MCASLKSKPYQVWEGEYLLSYYPLWDEYYLNNEPIPDIENLSEEEVFQLSTVLDIEKIRKLQDAIKGRIQ